MKRLLTMLVLGLFSATMIGCEASARVDDPDDREVERRRTTVRDREGDVQHRTETRTEIRRDR